MSNLQKKWTETLELAEKKIDPSAFNTWFKDLHPLKLDSREKKLYVQCDSTYTLERFNSRWNKPLKEIVEKTFGLDLDVIITVKGDDLPYPLKMGEYKNSESAPKEKKNNLNLDREFYFNPRYNFDSFVVGKNNEYAHAVSLAVADFPAEQNIQNKYNPFFIYGGSGLGKTHLLHAIGHQILKKRPELNVLYVSSEMFTNELIVAISRNKTEEVRAKYREIDVLLIDDIQFLEGKEATQDEFFHTFNTLYDRNKQIIISGDRHPKKLTLLDQRLTTRFLWNITADIHPPDFENRVSILLNKAEQENILLSDDVMAVINLIAEKIKYNVRELEGAFNRIVSFSTLLKKPIDIILAREVLRDIISTTESVITVDKIKEIVVNHFNITMDDMDSSKRSRKFSYPRQIAMYLCKEMTENSLPKIGKSFGGRDHTTVLHACKKVGESIERDEELKGVVMDLTEIINNK